MIVFAADPGTKACGITAALLWTPFNKSLEEGLKDLEIIGSYAIGSQEHTYCGVKYNIPRYEDIEKLLYEFDHHDLKRDAVAFIEDIYPFRIMNRPSVFCMGLSVGALRMGMASRGIIVNPILPSEWRLHHGIVDKTPQKIINQIAFELFPSVDFYGGGKTGRGIHTGKVASALMLSFGLSKLWGKLFKN